MRKYLAFLAASLAFSGATQGAERQANLPLVTNGDTAVTTTDFEAYLEKVPEKLRADFRANLERVKPTVDGLWVYRRMAKKARDAGLADDPAIAARVLQAQEMALAEAYMQLAEKKLNIPDLTSRARELYVARQADFKVPEQVRVQHILVAVNDCRNAEQALARAKEIRARVASGDEKAFAAEVQKSSDDPSKKANNGDLGSVNPATFEAPFAAAVAKLKKAGEVSEPVETRYGYHILRFVSRQPEKVKPFDEVKEEIIAAERQKIVDTMRTAEVNAIRVEPGTHVHIENVEALSKAGKAGAATARKQ